MSNPGDTIGQKHGAGGPAMRALIENVFVAGLGLAGAGLASMDDGAVIIEEDDGRRHLVPLGVITRANLEVEF